MYTEEGNEDRKKGIGIPRSNSDEKRLEEKNLKTQPRISNNQPKLRHFEKSQPWSRRICAFLNTFIFPPFPYTFFCDFFLSFPGMFSSLSVFFSTVHRPSYCTFRPKPLLLDRHCIAVGSINSSLSSSNRSLPSMIILTTLPNPTAIPPFPSLPIGPAVETHN